MNVDRTLETGHGLSSTFCVMQRVEDPCTLIRLLGNAILGNKGRRQTKPCILGTMDSMMIATIVATAPTLRLVQLLADTPARTRFRQHTVDNRIATREAELGRKDGLIDRSNLHSFKLGNFQFHFTVLRLTSLPRTIELLSIFSCHSTRRFSSFRA
jgi:hypothetical protein